MKMNGKKVDAVNFEYAVIPRPATFEPKLDDAGLPVKDEAGSPVLVEKNNDLVFKAKAVLDYTEFEKLCPAPKPPRTRRVADNQEFDDINSPKYMAAMQIYASRRTAWTFLESLSATDSLEWELVDRANPETWSTYGDELTKSGFTWREVMAIEQAVWDANSLNEAKLNEAKKRFLAGQGKV